MADRGVELSDRDPAVDDYYIDDDLPEDDDDLMDDLMDDCGMMANGQCTLAGSEWCDWDCPRGKELARGRIKAMKQRARP